MQFCDFEHRHKDDVIELLAAYTGIGGSQRRALWNWLYLDNPFIGNARRGLVLIDNNRVLGFTGFVPIQLWRNGARVNAAWSIDAVISPDFRGKGYGGQLVELVKSSYPIVFGKGISDRQATTKLNRGYWANEEIEQYFYTNRPGSLREWAKCVLQIANRILNFDQRTDSNDLTIDIGNASELPMEMNQLWNNVANSYQNIVVRDLAYMNWRYRNHPFKKYRTMVVRDSGRLRALAIFEKHERRSNLLDYVGASNDRQSMGLIVGTFVAACADSCLLQCTCTNEHLKSTLEIYGFRRYRVRPRFYVYSCLESDNGLAKNWFVMGGDSDSDFYLSGA